MASLVLLVLKLSKKLVQYELYCFGSRQTKKWTINHWQQQRSLCVVRMCSNWLINTYTLYIYIYKDIYRHSTLFYLHQLNIRHKKSNVPIVPVFSTKIRPRSTALLTHTLWEWCYLLPPGSKQIYATLFLREIKGSVTLSASTKIAEICKI